MSAIYRLGQRFGTQYVIGVMRGMQNQKIKDHQHDSLSVYGIGKDKSKEYWQSVIRQLIHLGLIQQVMSDVGGRLQLTESARPVLRGEVPLQLATPRLSSISTVQAPQRSAVNNYDKDLFARLRFLRKQIADKENIPPYVVFSDASLQEMALYQPINNAEMLQINGVGAVKLERFGQAFLSVIRDHKNAVMQASKTDFKLV